MPTDLTGTPTALGIGTYNVSVDAPSGLGFNAAMGQIDALIAARAALNSPTFTGTPLAPTPASPTDNSQKIATTAWVAQFLNQGIGYTTGAGGTATVAGTGAATCNHICGQVTWQAQFLPLQSYRVYTVNNSTVDSNDVVVLSGTNLAGATFSVTDVANDLFKITVWAPSTTDNVPIVGTVDFVFNFTVIKSVTS